MAVAAAMELPLDAAPEAGTDEGRWIAASLRGDRDAFSRLVSLHQRTVFRRAGRFFRRREDVEDVAQDVFLTAWRKLGTYRAEAPFEHWLTRICLNCCYERLRKRRVPEEPLDDGPEPAGREHDPSAAVEIERLLALVGPADRFVLLLLYGEGWSVAEIAERLGWSRANVKVRAHRARRKLRRILEREPEP